METVLIMEKDYYRFGVLRNFEEYETLFCAPDGDFYFWATTAMFKNVKLELYYGFRIEIGNCGIDLLRDPPVNKYRFYTSTNGWVTNSTILRTIEKIKRKVKPIVDEKELSKEEIEERERYDKECNEFCEKARTENEHIYRQIIEKKWFDENLKLYFSLEDIWGENIPLNVFFERSLKWEKCLNYVKENLNIQSLKKYYPQIKEFSINTEKVENLCAFTAKDLNVYTWERLDWAGDWAQEIPDEVLELKKELERIYLVANEWNNENIAKKLKEIYTIDKVLLEFSSEVEKIVDLKDMTFFLNKFLKNCCCISEKQLKKEIAFFFDNYLQHQKESVEFRNKYGEEYRFDYTEEKELKYCTGQYKSEEEEEAKLFLECFKAFQETVYIKGTTKFLHRYQFFCEYMQYAKELLKELFECGVLIENNDNEIFFGDVEKFKDIPEELLDFDNWLKSDTCLLFQEEQKKLRCCKFKAKREELKNKILADKSFGLCKNESSRLRYLKDVIKNAYDSGESNYYEALDAYAHNKHGVCFSGGRYR